MLAVGLTVLVVSGAALGWYPSQIGGPAYWLDDQLYRGPVAFLSQPAWWPTSAAALFAAGLALAFGGYLLAVARARRSSGRGQRALWLVLGVQIGLSGWLAIQPYLSSQDIFSYAFYAHIFAWYHANPYVAIPQDFPFDPLFSAIFWKDQPSNYGPLWIYLSALAPLLVGVQTGPTLLVLKGIVILAEVGTTPLIWATLGRLRPADRLAGALLYAWNPLLLIESAEAGHNDVVMAFFLVLSLFLWFRSRRTLSIGALVLAALVKYVAVLLLPLYLALWLREMGVGCWVLGVRVRASPTLEPLLRQLIAPTLLALALTAAAIAPLYAGLNTLGVIGFGANALAYTNSPLELAFRQLRVILGQSSDVANLPLHYRGFWVGVEPSGILWSEPDPTRATGISLPRGEPLLVVELPAGAWLHVYEPAVGRFGYIEARNVQSIAAPQALPPSVTTTAVLDNGGTDPISRESNVILRVASVLAFLPGFWLIARRVRDSQTLIRASLLALLLFLVVVQSWFWPWYLLWALPLAVLAADTFAGRALILLTATTLVLNAQPSVSPTPVEQWLYEVRMVAIDGLPFAVVGVAWWRGRRSGPNPLAPFPPREGGTKVVEGSPFPRREGGEGVGSGPDPRLALLACLAIFLAFVGAAAAQRAAAEAPPPAVIAWERDYGDAQRAYSAGDYATAVDDLNRVLAAQPNLLAASQLRAAAYLGLRRYGDAIPDVSRLLAANPGNLPLLLERGDLYVKIQRGDLAEADFAQAEQEAPYNPTVYEEAGLAAYAAGDLDQARELLARALSLAPNDSRIASQLADVFATQGEWQTALNLYDVAIRANPTDEQTYANRAALLQQQGFTDASVPDLQKVLVLSGDLGEHDWAAGLLAEQAQIPPHD
jgi:tetratricopeptide (TPR) repeat protein